MARKKVTKVTRTTARTSVAAAEPAAIEEVDAGGLGIDDGMVITTTLLLAAAVVLMYFAIENRYGPVF
jgi:hypothetical protein